MAIRVKVGVMRDVAIDKDTKKRTVKKIYGPGDTLPDAFVKKNESAVISGLAAGSLVEV